MTDFAAVDLGRRERARGARAARRRARGARGGAPLRQPAGAAADGLRWNLLSLFTETLAGLRGARRRRWPASGSTPGASTTRCWTGADRVLGLPFHYRDERTDGMIDRAHARVPRAELYAATGIQTMPINTVFQLLADEGTPALAAAERIALVPDLIALLAERRAGQRGHQRVHHRAARRPRRHLGAAADRAARACRPRRSPASRSRPGRRWARVLGHHGSTRRCTRSPATTPRRRSSPRRCATRTPRSSRRGTWSLLGLELDAPVLSDAARDVQPDQRARRRRHDPAAAQRDGAVARAGVRGARWGPPTTSCRTWPARPRRDVPLFDPDDDALLRPGDMPARIAEACRAGGQEPPEGRGEVVRSILVSLACKYRLVLERLMRVTGRDVEVRARDRRRRPQRAAVPADRRPARAHRAGRPGRGDRARQRARAGARRRRARLAGRDARRRRRVGDPTVYEPSADAGGDLPALPRQ